MGEFNYSETWGKKQKSIMREINPILRRWGRGN